MLKDFFREYLGIMVYIAVVLIITFIIFGVIIAKSQGIFYNIERSNIKKSNQYIETVCAKLQSMYTEWTRLNTEVSKYEAETSAGNEKIISDIRIQQRALVNQMRGEADKIPKEEVPRSVAQILDSR